MDVRNNLNWNSKRVEDFEPPVLKEVETIRLVLLRNTVLKIRGKVTGKDYYFSGAGSVLEVDKKDAPSMLGMRRNACNCSGMPGLPYFEMVGG